MRASGAQLGAYQNRFTAAIAGINTDGDQPDERPQLDPGHGLRPGHLGAVQGPDPAAGQYGDGGQANTVPQNVLTLLQKLP